MTRSPRLAFGLALLALAWTAWRTPEAPAPAFAPPPVGAPSAVGASPPRFSAQLLPSAAASAHAASLTELADGRLVAAWFAGSREGAEDVAIYLSRLETSGWSRPEAIATRPQTARELRRHLRKLGNPVLHVDPAGRLHLFFVSVSLGGWAGASINHKFSDDGGRHWSPARKLGTSPFFNISTLVRNPPIRLEDGGLGLPIYHEFIAKHGEWLRLDAQGRIIDKVRMPHARATLQPAVAALDARRAVALLRDAGPSPGSVQRADSQDAGQHWEMRPALPIAHANASMALLRLGDGSLLMAGNPGSGRASLLLYRSTDEGRTWQSLGPVESGAATAAGLAPEFSYPALLQDRNGDIHLAYTWLRQGIRHVVFNAAWLAARAQGDVSIPAIPTQGPRS